MTADATPAGSEPPGPAALPDRTAVAVVGGGQAGLSVSRLLGAAGVDHVVLERQTACHVWSDERWDSFHLVTPNWQCRLPGWEYDGPYPDGFMTKEQVVDWLARFRASFDAPLWEHCEVSSVRRDDPAGPFQVAVRGRSGERELLAGAVVVATGGYHDPVIPRVAERLPGRVRQVPALSYRNPASLPPGEVLVVGSGQSGAQIAEDLHLAGRTVHLALGGAPRVSRRYRGRDVVAWLDEMGHYDVPITSRPPAERHHDGTNHYVTGRDGGRDIDLRSRAVEGMRLHGRLLDVRVEAEGARIVAVLGGDAAVGRHLDHADAVNDSIKDSIDAWIDRRGIAAPDEDRTRPVWAPPTASQEPHILDTSAVSAVVWATGLRRGHRFLHVPAFDGMGRPAHVRGVSSTVAGLYFIGLPWLHTWGSGRFASVARDAEHITAHLAAHLAQFSGEPFSASRSVPGRSTPGAAVPVAGSAPDVPALTGT